MFCIFFEIEVKSINSFNILAFIEFLIESQLSVPTVKNYISSLKSRFKALGVRVAAFESPRVALVLTALEKNKKYVPKPKPVITPAQFHNLFLTAEVLGLKRFFRIAILLAYMGFMRISNLAPKSPASFDILRDIRRGDVKLTAQGITVFLRCTKTLQKFNQSASIPLHSISGSQLCPKKNFMELQAAYPVKANDPLLSYYSGSHLYVITQTQLRPCFSNLIQKLNFNKNLTFHSLRRSGASLAFASGVQFSTIQAHGTWTSDSLWSYIHHSARDHTIPALFSTIYSGKFGFGG
jgi:integrase